MSNTTTNYQFQKPLYGTEPVEAQNLDAIDTAIKAAFDHGGGGGGPHFAAPTLDSTILTNLSVSNSGGQSLIAAVAGKIIIPVNVVAKFHYGGNVYSNVALNDLVLTPEVSPAAYPETLWIGSSQGWLDQTSDAWQIFSRHEQSQANLVDSNGGADLFIANNVHELAGGAGSTVTFYIQYVLFDIAGEVFD